MSTSRDDSAILVVTAIVLVLLLGGGLAFLVQRARTFRAMAMAEQARAAEIQARVRLETARAEQDALAVSAAKGEVPEPAVPERTQQDAARAAADFIRDSISAADPGNPKTRDLLQKAAAKIDEAPLKDDPISAASVHITLGQAYLKLSDLDAAERQFKAALELHTKALGESDPAVAADRDNLDKVARARGAAAKPR